MPRLDRDTLFLDVARLFAERSTCARADVGAVIVREKRIISTGYNGAPPGMPHCEGVGCEHEFVKLPWYGREDEFPEVSVKLEGCARTVHAEANAIAYAARAGISTDCGVMYCTHAPCYTCAKLMVSAGIIECHYNIEYRDERGIELLDKANVVVTAHGSRS